VTHAAREAARAAAVSDADRLEASVRAARQAGDLEEDRLGVTVSMLEGDSSVRVVVSYRSPTDLALVGALVPDITLDASVVMRVESG